MEKSKSKFVLWFTGLSGSGKTTIGNEIRKELINFGYEKIIVLDGDDLRRGINSNLDYSDKDRSEANRRAVPPSLSLASLSAPASNRARTQDA